MHVRFSVASKPNWEFAFLGRDCVSAANEIAEQSRTIPAKRKTVEEDMVYVGEAVEVVVTGSWKELIVIGTERSLKVGSALLYLTEPPVFDLRPCST